MSKLLLNDCLCLMTMTSSKYAFVPQLAAVFTQVSRGYNPPASVDTYNSAPYSMAPNTTRGDTYPGYGGTARFPYQASDLAGDMLPPHTRSQTAPYYTSRQLFNEQVFLSWKIYWTSLLACLFASNIHKFGSFWWTDTYPSFLCLLIYLLDICACLK